MSWGMDYLSWIWSTPCHGYGQPLRPCAPAPLAQGSQGTKRSLSLLSQGTKQRFSPVQTQSRNGVPMAPLCKGGWIPRSGRLGDCRLYTPVFLLQIPKTGLKKGSLAAPFQIMSDGIIRRRTARSGCRDVPATSRVLLRRCSPTGFPELQPWQLRSPQP